MPNQVMQHDCCHMLSEQIHIKLVVRAGIRLMYPSVQLLIRKLVSPNSLALSLISSVRCAFKLLGSAVSAGLQI